MPRGRQPKTDDFAETTQGPSAGLLRALLLQELLQGPNYPTGLANVLQAKQVALPPSLASTLLQDMKNDGLLTSKLIFGENGRPRREYTLTAKGRAAVPEIRASIIDSYRAALKFLGAG